MERERQAELDRAYEILNLGREASLEEVKEAYAAAVRVQGGSKSDWMRQKETDWAYGVLLEHLYGRSATVRPREAEEGAARTLPERPSLLRSLKMRVFAIDEDASRAAFYGKAVFSLVLLVWGLSFIFSSVEGDEVGRSFMHLVNLPFHEAGHVIFSFFGDFFRVFGGTLAQVLVPVICVVAFLQRSDVFGASCALWWVGQSFVDAAPYIYDARAGDLMLLGGVTGREAPEFHDWNNMLSRLGLLSWDHALGYTAKVVGALLILTSVTWCCWYLYNHRFCLRKSRT